jgi:hypothetical protein
MEPPLDYLPRRKDWRIGCAGAGFIMRDCHLVAYRQAGFNPVAVASRTVARAREAAQRHAVPRVHALRPSARALKTRCGAAGSATWSWRRSTGAPSRTGCRGARRCRRFQRSS